MNETVTEKELTEYQAMVLAFNQWLELRGVKLPTDGDISPPEASKIYTLAFELYEEKNKAKITPLMAAGAGLLLLGLFRR
jgi:hypothetical protein